MRNKFGILVFYLYLYYIALINRGGIKFTSSRKNRGMAITLNRVAVFEDGQVREFKREFTSGDFPNTDKVPHPAHTERYLEAVNELNRQASIQARQGTNPTYTYWVNFYDNLKQ